MAGRKEHFFVKVDVSAALRVLRKLPKEASRELRKASKEIVQREVPRIQSAATTRQARAAAKSVRPASDRVPAIQMGGKKRVTSAKNGYAGSIVFGSDAGAPTWDQFPKPPGDQWFWNQLGKDASDIMSQWGDAYDGVIERWSDGRGR